VQRDNDQSSQLTLTRLMLSGAERSGSFGLPVKSVEGFAPRGQSWAGCRAGKPVLLTPCAK